jgi:diguanylate cyclase (GGDEF)-like protein
MRFDHVTMDDGLSQSAVVAIAQDSKGFMWFGTENGLNRFDGYEFEHFMRERGNPNALRSDFIYSLATDDNGRVWIGTKGGGLSALDANTGSIRNFRHDANDPSSIAGDIVRTVLIDKGGAVWLGLRNAGLDRFDPATGTFTHFPLPAPEDGAASVFALHEAASGTIWAGTENGLYALDPKTGDMRGFRHDPKDDRSIASDRVRAVFEDSRRNLWVGTHDGGLNHLDRKSGTFERFQHDPAAAESISSNRVRTILEDEDGRLWVGTEAGLNLMDRDRGRFTHFRREAHDGASLGADSVLSLFQDRTGILWVGTLNAGISKWNPRTWGLGLREATVLSGDGEAQPNVLAFAAEGADKVWIGTFGDGLIRLDRKTGEKTELRHDPADSNSISDDRVMSLFLDNRGMLWTGTMGGGLNRIDTASGRNTVFRHDPDDATSLSADGVMTIFEDREGLVWVGTFGGGISVYDYATDRFSRHDADPATQGALSGARVTSFAQDARGDLWIGTDGGGLNLYDRDTGKFHVYRYDDDDPKSLADNTVYAVHVDALDRVWVGTRGGGLDRVVGSSAQPGQVQFANISQTGGLPNNVVYGVQSDASGELWLSTNYGISRLNPETGEIRNLHRRDGLQSEEFNFNAHHRSSTGELYFGGPSGFNVFNPETLTVSSALPAVILTGFFKGNDPLKADLPDDPEAGIDLGYRDDQVSFEVAALDYAAPEANRYMYKLEGFDEDWIDLGNRRRITYTDLDDGSYVLRVKAANSDGVWNEAGITIPVRVAPAPWDTWWAYLGYLAMAVQLAVFLYLGHARKIRREEEYSNRLEQEVRARTNELAERNDELRELNRSLQESSLSDPLTGLRNRRFVFEEVSRELATISRKYDNQDQGLPEKDAADLVFMMIDLDNFKPINDTYGHAAGDKLLLDIRDVLLGTCRRSDFVIRWGGDEFVIIAKQAHRGESEALAERIRREVASQNFTLPDGQFVRTTCSIGFAAFPLFRNQAGNAGLDDVIGLADSLMYEAKRQRNSWVGMLGIDDAVTSEGFDTDSIDATSLLFRARRRGQLIEHRDDSAGEASGRHTLSSA